MREFQQKKKISKVKNSIWLGAIVLFLTFILLSSVLELYQKKRQVLKLGDESRLELERLTEKSSEVSLKSALLDTPRGIEQMIREKYNIRKEGEQVVVIMDQEVKDEGIKVVKKDIWHSVKTFMKNLFDR